MTYSRMREPQPRTQQIIVVGLVRADGQVLLTRSSQLRNAASATGGGYFDLPRFAVPFAADPSAVLARELRELCDQVPTRWRTVSIEQYLTQAGTRQVFEVVLEGEVAPTVPSQPGRYTFAELDEAADLMFEEEFERLRTWLERGR